MRAVKEKKVPQSAMALGGMARGSAVRVSVAKDRTVKRLLADLVTAGERAGRHDVITLAMRLRSVLIEIGHDV